MEIGDLVYGCSGWDGFCGVIVEIKMSAGWTITSLPGNPDAVCAPYPLFRLEGEGVPRKLLTMWFCDQQLQRSKGGAR